MAGEGIQNLAHLLGALYRGQHIPAMTRDLGLTRSHPKDRPLLA